MFHVEQAAPKNDKHIHLSLFHVEQRDYKILENISPFHVE